MWSLKDRFWEKESGRVVPRGPGSYADQRIGNYKRKSKGKGKDTKFQLVRRAKFTIL
jgi:hypothetical protein